MIDGTVAKRYAEALFEVAKENNQLEKIEADLKLVAEVMQQTELLMDFLRHPQIDGLAKKELIKTAFKDSISSISENFLSQLIDSNRVEFFEEILKMFIKYANEVRGVIDVEAITAITLDDANKTKVIETLKQKFNKQVRLQNIVDPSILGGIIVKIGDRVYDGSINKQLKLLERSLMASRV